MHMFYGRFTGSARVFLVSVTALCTPGWLDPGTPADFALPAGVGDAHHHLQLNAQAPGVGKVFGLVFVPAEPSSCPIPLSSEGNYMARDLSPER